MHGANDVVSTGSRLLEGAYYLHSSSIHSLIWKGRNLTEKKDIRGGEDSGSDIEAHHFYTSFSKPDWRRNAEVSAGMQAGKGEDKGFGHTTSDARRSWDAHLNWEKCEVRPFLQKKLCLYAGWRGSLTPLARCLFSIQMHLDKEVAIAWHCLEYITWQNFALFSEATIMPFLTYSCTIDTWIKSTKVYTYLKCRL